jgi:CubicO group peptidase (beta-lactamase class C family)
MLGAATIAVACSATDGGDDAAVDGDTSAPTTGSTTTGTATRPTGSTPAASAPAMPAPPDTAPAPAPATTTAGASAAFDAVDPIVEAHVAERGLDGAALVVVDAELGVVHEAYWGVFGPDRVSLIASSSKMIAAGVLLALDDEGTLDLDAPVADVVDWGDANPDITPAQLLSNSSGLPGLAGGFAVLPYLCQFLPVGSLQGCAETIFTTPFDDGSIVAPDTEFRYGGAQWQVAGAVAEVASGSSWNDLVADTYRSCGVESLGFGNHWTRFGEFDFDYPTGFDADPASLGVTDNPNIEGGAYIDPPDYAGLLLMLLRGGRCGDEQVLTAASVERMLTDRIGEVYGGSDGDAVDRGYGLGWFVDRTSGRRLDPGAYGTVPWIDPDLGYAAHLVVEATGRDGDDLAARLFDVVETAVLENRNTVDG